MSSGLFFPLIISRWPLYHHVLISGRRKKSKGHKRSMQTEPVFLSRNSLYPQHKHLLNLISKQCLNLDISYLFSTSTTVVVFFLSIYSNYFSRIDILCPTNAEGMDYVWFYLQFLVGSRFLFR